VSKERVSSKVRKRQIAVAAFELICAQGIKRISISSVAHRVGVVPSAIYRHFRGKLELLESVLGLIEESLQRNLSEARATSCEPEVQLRHLLFLHTKLIRENVAIPRLLFSDDVQFGDARLRKRTYGILREYIGGVRKILDEGKEVGRVQANVDSAAASLLFIGILQPAALIWHLSEGSFDVTRQIEKAWEIYRAQVFSFPTGTRKNGQEDTR